MRPLLAAAVLAIAALVVAAPAFAADARAPLPSPKPTVTMHYPTLEKMLRKFSREAGAARTRG
ncbi:MAG: hypothetical protein JWM53_2518 [bacterium]|nr:hypothetical protein [bacterium]